MGGVYDFTTHFQITYKALGILLLIGAQRNGFFRNGIYPTEPSNTNGSWINPVSLRRSN